MASHTKKSMASNKKLFETLNKEKKLKRNHKKVFITDLRRILPHMFQCNQSKWNSNSILINHINLMVIPKY